MEAELPVPGDAKIDRRDSARQTMDEK